MTIQLDQLWQWERLEDVSQLWISQFRMIIEQWDYYENIEWKFKNFNS